MAGGTPAAHGCSTQETGARGLGFTTADGLCICLSFLERELTAIVEDLNNACRTAQSVRIERRICTFRRVEAAPAGLPYGFVARIGRQNQRKNPKSEKNASLVQKRLEKPHHRSGRVEDCLVSRVEKSQQGLPGALALGGRAIQKCLLVASAEFGVWVPRVSSEQREKRKYMRMRQVKGKVYPRHRQEAGALLLPPVGKNRPCQGISAPERVSNSSQIRDLA